MPRRFYIDSSAYLCILLGEREHEVLQREIAGGELLASALLVLESQRNLVRLAREGVIAPGDLTAALGRVDSDLEIFTLRDLTLDLCRAPLMPIVSTPRSLDLAHLRTALWFHERAPLTRFVTLDEAQAQAARELGLPV